VSVALSQRHAVAAAADFSAPAPRALALTRLTLADFRSYARLKITLTAQPVVLTGDNGAGKTNILEAISFLSPGRGLRQAALADVTRRGGAGWAVAATVHGYDGAVDVGTGLVAGDGVAAARRTVRIGGTAIGQQSRLASVAQVTWLTPAMDRLFIETAPSRRRFLDRLTYGFDNGHARRVAAYERVMRQRSKLLRTGVDDPRWLGALEETMAEHAVAIAAARRDAVFRLEGGLRASTGAFPAALLAVEGWVEAALDRDSALGVEHALRDKLAQARPIDAETGGAAHGVHRSDFAVRHADKDMQAAACSTGEQKALLIAIVLAQARIMAGAVGAVPMLLLDEVVAHLDRRRRRALCAELRALGAQAWLTGTDRALFADLDGWAQFFNVSGGTVAVETNGLAS